MSNDILKAAATPSRFTPFGTVEEMQHCISTFLEANAVVWYYDSIEFYRISSGAWDHPLRDHSEWVRLRLFNKVKELHCWRTGQGLRARLRNDTDGEQTEYLPASLLLNGTRFDETTTGLLVTEDKGIRYELPYKEMKGLAGTKGRIFLETRNYIGHNEIGQAGITDCRFVNFTFKQ